MNEVYLAFRWHQRTTVSLVFLASGPDSLATESVAALARLRIDPHARLTLQAMRGYPLRRGGVRLEWELLPVLGWPHEVSRVEELMKAGEAERLWEAAAQMFRPSHLQGESECTT